MTQPSGPTELVTLSDVTAHLNIDNPTADQQNELNGFINAATAYIQSFTGPIIPQQFTETHNGGGTTIVVYNPPVMQIDSVVEYIGPTGYTLTRADLGTDGGTYAYSLDDPRAGIIRRRWNGGIVGPFIGGERNVLITYWGGQSAVPADIRMAVLQDIAGLYQPSQLGTNPYGGNDPSLGNAPLNPIGMFPRVAEILSATARRAPSIA